MAKNWAISIGINRYKHMHHLSFAGRDAKAMRDFFKIEADFDKVYYFSEDSPPIKDKDCNKDYPSRPNLNNLEIFLNYRFENSCLSEGDNLWFFFSGHGLRHEEEDYLLPYDADPNRVQRTALSLQYVVRRLRKCGADNIILILDACRNEGKKGQGQAIGKQKQKGIITIASCSPYETAYEIKDLQHGSFTYALLQGLRGEGGKNCATVERLAEYLRREVPKINRRHGQSPQTPYVTVEPSSKSEYILLPKQARDEDVGKLKYQASQAELSRNYPLAKQLWIRVNIAAGGEDMDAVDAFGRLKIKNISQFKERNNQSKNPKGNLSSQSKITTNTASLKPSLSPPNKPKGSELKIGDVFSTQLKGATGKVENLLGSGTKGKVYQVSFQGTSKAKVLKWYSPQWIRQEPQQKERLEQAIKLGTPHENFCWPLDLVSIQGSDSYGYIMPLLEPRFKSTVGLVQGRIEQPTYRSRVIAGFNLAESFKQLYSQGLCYRGLSLKDIYFDPETGEIRICNTDNVSINGSSVSARGNLRFMAPEIVRGEASPTTQTDLYSLAVLVFYLLFLHHPLEGAKRQAIRDFNQAAMQKLYGIEPVFIFDPYNPSNRPVPGKQDNFNLYWSIYPQFVRDLFTQAFTEGIRNPQRGRSSQSEWRNAMIQLRDSIFDCLHCGAENFYDLDTLKQQRKLNPCWLCGKEISLPFRLRLEKSIVMLNYDTKLYPHHVNDHRRYDFSAPVAEVNPHPKDPNRLGLKNLSSEVWTATKADNTLKTVEPGRSIQLASGIKINFCTKQGEIQI